jgi:glucose-6-phosphate-specific signal transduction histidine kinase
MPAEGTAWLGNFPAGGRSLRPARSLAVRRFLVRNLLRIHQEIVTNALKHSGATVLEATFSFEENAVRLEVRDDGGGFDLSQKHDGLGLLGIRERVNQMKGDLTVDSRVGIGTRICVVLPNEGESRGSQL